MKNKLGISACFIAAAAAAFAAVSFLYKHLAFDGLGISLDLVHTAALPILAVIFAVAAVVRLIVPHIFKELPDGENKDAEDKEPGLIVRCLNWAAWLFFALCLSALIASPLAGIADYISYAAIFGVISVLCALFPTVGVAEKLSLYCEKVPSTAVFTAVTLILSFVPAVGIYGGNCGIVFYVTALREEKAPTNQCRTGLIASMICTLLAAAATFFFVYILF